MATTFTLPELGENIEFGKVTKVMVAVGDTVAADQPVVELETDKAVVEVPCPVAGTIVEMHAQEGMDLPVGAVILVIVERAPATGKSSEAASPDKSEAKIAAPAQEKEPVATPPKAPPVPVASPQTALLASPPLQTAGGRRAAASPSVRRLAREIAVDLALVRASSPTGRISLKDVKDFARLGNGASQGGGAAAAPAALPDFSKWGPVRREEMSGVRRTTATRMAAAWATIPHVTQNDEADGTRLEAIRKKYGKKAEAQGGKLTVTAILVKLLAAALKQFPQFNSSLDVAKNEIVYKEYFNVGVAVDTDRGLLVPVIRDVDRKNVIEISVELSDLAQRARERKLKLDEMQGGCITLTNLGGIGGTGFSPIVNPPEVAILGVSRSNVKPVFEDGAFVPRTMVPLSLSFDHRVIDGAAAARFTRWLCEALEEPFLPLLEG